MPRKPYKVTNTTDRKVERGGYVFPPHTSKVVHLSEYQYRHIKFKVGFQVEAVKPTRTRTVEQPSSFDAHADTSAGEEDQNNYPCPYCDDYIGESEKGLKAHIRLKHGGGESEQ